MSASTGSAGATACARMLQPNHCNNYGEECNEGERQGGGSPCAIAGLSRNVINHPNPSSSCNLCALGHNNECKVRERQGGGSSCSIAGSSRDVIKHTNPSSFCNVCMEDGEKSEERERPGGGSLRTIAFLLCDGHMMNHKASSCAMNCDTSSSGFCNIHMLGVCNGECKEIEGGRRIIACNSKFIAQW